MTDFGNTVGDDFDRDSTPDKYIERKEAMTPLDAAQAIIDARARGTMGEWKHGRDISHFDAPEVVTDRYSAHIPVLEDAELIALSANHAAAVAQALIDAEKRVAELVDRVLVLCNCIEVSCRTHPDSVIKEAGMARDRINSIMGKETHDDA